MGFSPLDRRPGSAGVLSTPHSTSPPTVLIGPNVTGDGTFGPWPAWWGRDVLEGKGVNDMSTALARWRDSVFAPLDLSNGLIPLFTPDIRVEQVVEDGRLLIRAELPGVDPAKEVELTVLNGVLKIHAERSAHRSDKAHTEFQYGRLERVVTLPPGVLEDSGKATYTHGILEITFTMREPREPGRHIPIEKPKSTTK